MISQRQFTDALTFVRSYKDALECVEQIAERRASYAHYEGLARTVVGGIEGNQLKVDHGHVFPGTGASEFPLVKAHTFAKTQWTQYGLQNVSSSDELNNKLDKAIKDLETKVGKQ